jgi:four helix bundle protein
MAVTRFEDLEVWQEATSLAVDVYTVSNSGGFKQDFGFRDQIRRSAVSIAANIAEGKERETVPEFVRYLYIAKGSSGELKTHLVVAERIGFIEPGQAKNLLENVEKVSAKLGSLIRTLKSK